MATLTIPLAKPKLKGTVTVTKKASKEPKDEKRAGL